MELIGHEVTSDGMMDRISTPDGSPPPRWRWTLDRYHRAADAGCFGDEKVELIGGQITQEGMADRMSPQKAPHPTAVGLVADLLQSIFPEGAHVRVQASLLIPDDGEPEPDVAVIAGSRRDYASQHPTTALLVVEVSDTTLRYHRTTKASQYAKGDIPDYWILNLPERCLEVHRDPAPDPEQPVGAGYRTVLRLAEDECIAPLSCPERSLLVRDILP